MKSAQAWGLLVLRVVLGVTFHLHGDQKVAHMGIANVTAMMVRFGIPLPHAAAVVISYLEFVAGLALIVGVATRLFALLLTADMAVVIFWVKLHDGFFAPHGFEFELLLLAACVCLALTGAGAIAVDRVFSRRMVANFPREK